MFFFFKKVSRKDDTCGFNLDFSKIKVRDYSEKTMLMYGRFDLFVFIYGAALKKSVKLEGEEISVKHYLQLHEVDDR